MVERGSKKARNPDGETTRGIPLITPEFCQGRNSVFQQKDTGTYTIYRRILRDERD